MVQINHVTIFIVEVEKMINYTFWDNDYNEILLQKEVQHTKEEIQEMALEFFNNYEKYRVDEDYNYCENFIQYLVTQRGFSFPKVEDGEKEIFCHLCIDWCNGSKPYIYLLCRQ